MTFDIQHSTSNLLLMGLDLGTSVLKGVVMNAAGCEFVSAERPAAYHHPREGWVEADAATCLETVFDLIRQLAEEAPGPICALAFSGASGNTLLCDAAGSPLTPIINWMDQRAAQEPPEVLRALTVEQVRQVTGWPCIDRFPLGHLAWLREHEAALCRAAGRVCMNTDWLLFQLTGTWVMDHSTATTFHLQDQIAGQYHLPFLKMLDLSEEKLSNLTGSGVVAGTITPEAAARTGLSSETRIVTGCFDHPSAARATGVLEPGQLLLSCGTSWVGLFPEADRQKLIDAELLCDPFLSEHGGPWAGMVSVPMIGRTINAYIHEFIASGEPDPYAVFNEAAAACDRCTLEIDLRKPACAVNAGREELARAVMESAARLLNEKLDEQRANGFCFERAVLVGGPSFSPVWPGIIEEFTDLRLRVGTAHSGARGAAMLAGIGVGVYADEHDAFEKAVDIPFSHAVGLGRPADAGFFGLDEMDRRI